MKISLFIIIDFLFKFTLIFLLNLIWLLYCIKIPIISIIVSVLSTLLIIFIANKISLRKQSKAKITLVEKQKVQNITNTFIYMPNEDVVDFFYNLARTRHIVEKKGNFIVTVNESAKTALYPYFKNQELTPDNLIKFYNETKSFKIKKLIVVTNKLSAEIPTVIDNLNFNIIVLNNEQTYSLLLKEYEFYPEIKVKPKPNAKKTFSQILSYALNKKRTKSYVISALFLLFSSLFVRNKIYYLIFASILITLAIFSRFNTNFNKVNKQKLFD